jgi:hypothetical protein
LDSSVYHEILISNPRVDKGKMLIVLNIKDWDEHFCFYYPVSSIDHYHLMVHVIWKLSGDDQYIIRARAHMDIDQRDPEKLNIRNWNFI